jgi:guanylate kinase
MDQETLQLIKDYKTPETTIERLRDIEAVILTGITGAGKDTIIHVLLEDPNYVRVVTSTTRAPRVNDGVMEQDGVEYYFLTIEEAQEKMRNGEYIEVMPVHGQVNGSLVKEYERIANMGSVALTNIDYQGAAKFLTFEMRRLSVVFVIPPNFDIWFERLTKRYGGTLESDREEVLKRMRSAQKEIAYARSDPRFVPVLNDDIDRVASEIKTIVSGETQLADEIVRQNYAIMDDLLVHINAYLEANA